MQLIFYILQLGIIENLLKLESHVVYLFLNEIFLHRDLFLFEDSASLV